MFNQWEIINKFSHAHVKMETALSHMWIQELWRIFEVETRHCRRKLSEPLGKSNLRLVNPVKDFHSVRWHGVARTRKEISGGF